MLQIYQKALLKSTKKRFGEENENCILQEDNDPKTSQPFLQSVERRKWDHHLAVTFTISRCKSHQKCMISNEA